jgi:hypothetical protein
MKYTMNLQKIKGCQVLFSLFVHEIPIAQGPASLFQAPYHASPFTLDYEIINRCTQ